MLIVSKGLSKPTGAIVSPLGRVIEKRTHHGMPVLVDKEPITLAKLPPGAPLQESVLVHPRYVGESEPHEIIQFLGFRRGRTIDFFLDEPILYEGKRYGALNFKGVGADGKVDAFQLGLSGYFDLNGYVWGGQIEAEAAEEFKLANKLRKLDLPMVPHLAVNQVPESAVRAISKHEGKKMEPPPKLAQLVRLSKTNIRDEDGGVEYSPKNLALVDAAAFNALLQLARQGKILDFDSPTPMHTNRLIDGMLVDADNYEIRPYNFNSIAQSRHHDNGMLGYLIVDSTGRIGVSAGESGLGIYLRNISKAIGLNGFLSIKSDFRTAIKLLEKRLTDMLYDTALGHGCLHP